MFAATKVAISRSQGGQALAPLAQPGPDSRWPLVDLTQVAEHTRFITNVDLLQQTLRGAVRRAIEDPSFAALFASDAMILGQWPLTSR
jgi:hypothetical protein